MLESNHSALHLEVYIQSDIPDGIIPVTTPVPSTDIWQSWFYQWVVALTPSYSPVNAYELSLCFTTDAAIQALNTQYRHRDVPTDVLAFATIDGEDGDRPPVECLCCLPFPLGDIVISVETAQRQAQEQQHSLTYELAWLAAHGLLHLLGWDHPTDQRLAEMLDQQRTLLNAVDVA